LIYYLLLFSLPISVEWQLTETLGTDLPDEVLMWAMSLLVMLSLLLRPGFWLNRKADQTLLAFLVLHLAWILFTATLSVQPILSFKFLAAKLWYVVAFTAGSWWFLSDGKSLRIAFWCLVLPMSLALLWVLFNQARDGFLFDSVNAAVKPFFRNHVNYGAILVCLLPLPVAMAVIRKKERTWWIVCTMVWLVALFFSYSRGAWAALVVGGMACLLLYYRRVITAMWISLLLALGLLFYFFQDNRYLDYRPDFDQTIYHQDFSDHLQATYRLKDLSTAERFHRWIAGVRMVAEEPIRGHGPNRFYEAYKPYTVTAFRTYVSDNPEHSTVHNYFLLLAVEQGLPGLVFFLLIIMRMFSIIQDAYHRSANRKEKTGWMVMASVLAMIVWLNMLSDLVEADKIGSLFFICMGICLGAERWRQKEQARNS
jgi:O-antigen ligase